jgi:predicted transcriptional regulator
MTVSSLAKEIGVTPQAIYQKIKSKPFIGSFEKDINGKLILDGNTAEFIKSLFIKTPQTDTNTIKLAGKIETLENELKTEREQSRKMSEEIINLAKQIVEISLNNQILLGIEQNKTAPKMIEAENKKSFWSIFKKKKS